MLTKLILTQRLWVILGGVLAGILSSVLVGGPGWCGVRAINHGLLKNTKDFIISDIMQT